MNIKRLRKARGITQEELAAQLEVHENTIRMWEKGNRSPRISDIKRLCEIFQCTESELLSESLTGNWELRLVVSKTKEGGTIDMTSSKSSAVLNIGDDAMAITLSAPYELWSDDAKFEELLEDLRRKRATGLKTRREDW